MSERSERADAAALDAADPLAGFVERFVVADPGLIYLDGNSLGRLPRATADRLARAVAEDWGSELVRGWDRWVDLPCEVGDRIGAHLVGAGAHQMVVGDSTSVNLYKLAAAALDARADRSVIVTDTGNFPTDRYVLEGLAAARALDLRLVPTDLIDGVATDAVTAAVDEHCALVSLSAVDYRSGALNDVAAITRIAHERGALVLWDLSHAAGSVPVQLDADGVDLAVGCTYKYLNAGPGAPAFVYVRRDLHDLLRQPIWGWFGQRDQFSMGERYDPKPGIERFLVGTPPMIGLVAVDEGVRLLGEAGIDRIRAKGMAMTSLLVALADEWLAPLGFTLASPRDPEKRGAHVSLAHPEAYRMALALRAEAGVIPDFRTPDRLRLGPAPLATRFVDVFDAIDRLRQLVADGVHERFPASPGRVT